MDKDKDKTTINKRPTLSLKARRKPDPVPAPPAAVPVPQTPVAASPLSPPQKPKKQKAGAVEPSSAVPERAKRTSDEAAVRLSEWLGQHSVVWRDCKPLKVGVISDVYALLAEHGMQDTHSKRVIHKALHWHTSRIQYWGALVTVPERYGLDGEIAGEVTQAQRDYAQQQREELAAVWDKGKHQKN